MWLPKRPGARRRSELSTNRTRTVLLITLAQVATLAACRELRAQTAAAESAAASQAQGPSRPAAQKPISREDAELMLREAHSLIEQGRLEDADKIITRVEAAHVQFPLIHTGPTVSGMRKELERAQRLRAASRSLSHDPSNSGSRYLPFSRSSNSQTAQAQDPFAARTGNSTAGMANGNRLPPISAPQSQPSASAMADRRLDNGASTSSPTSITFDSPAGPRSINNPFAGTNSPAGLNTNTLAGAPATPDASLGYPAAHAANDPYSSSASNSASSNSLSNPSNPSGTDAANENRSWDLPTAPLPRGASDRQISGSSGLMPPKRTATDKPATANSAKQQAQQQLASARKALQAGDLDLAERLTQAANALGVPESQYLPDEDRPSLVAWDIAQAKRKSERTNPAINRLPATAPRIDAEQQSQPKSDLAPYRDGARQSVTPTDYRDDQKPNQQPVTPIGVSPAARNRPVLDAPSIRTGDEGPQMLAALPAGAANRPARPNAGVVAADELPLPLVAAPGSTAASDNGDSNGSSAAVTNSAVAADPAATEPRATDTLPAPLKPQPASPPARKSLIDSADEAQQVLIRKLDKEVLTRQSEAVRLREKDSERALATLREAQQMVNESKLPESTKRELLSRIDKTLHDTQEYAKAHGAQQQLEKQNAAVEASVDHDREMKIKRQQKIADMVNEYNQLNHEQRYAEAEIVARRLNELAPEDPIAKQVWTESKLLRRERMNEQLADAKDESFWTQLDSVERSAINPVAKDGEEIKYDQKKWSDLVAKRKGSKDRSEHRSERELDIERRLQTPVLLKYQDTPLTEVMKSLSTLAGVNIHLDPRGLSQEGVNSDTPITINLAKEVQLKSALHLILEPLHLSYVVSDEVLKVTSEQLRDGELITQTYNVADLVTPIPNFVPNSNIGLQGLINDSLAAAGHGAINVGNSNGASVLVNDRRQKLASNSNNVLAQQMGSQPMTPTNQSATVPIGAGPGGMGAAANADFDSLIDLIEATVATDTWAENGGGQAEIRPFPTNLSLVISQTQAVHEQIADLLQQLRRLQDLQVTIEVRFIRLNDNFFERIGIDFDMNIVDKALVGGTPVPGGVTLTNGQTQTATVGMVQSSSQSTFPTFTTDLDVPFRQGSFDVATPAFGGFDANSAATMGFAILSDIEAYFLIQAAQGDNRTNVLEAPKITLFNGQQAFVADATQVPFVVGVIPVVGEFASAQQPVIVVLNEGTMMTIQAVVSDDRRYVRMTIVPFFTQIGKVDTFTFEGSTSSTSSSSTTDSNSDGKNENKDDSTSNASTGVTVQLPQFSFVSVVTTVSVPDGGTVLLGGIKRLSEGRSEFGVPLLSKIPYINRLFRNVGIGRATESLMMMVTPRIIIQEEEEARLGIASP